MTLLKQVSSDLLKEIGWLLLYGFVSSIVIMTFVLVGLSYKQVYKQEKLIESFEKNKVCLIQVRNIQFNLNSLVVGNNIEDLETYFEKGLSGEGIFGSYVILQGYMDEFDKVIIYFGKYKKLIPFSIQSSQSTVFVVSDDMKDKIGQTINFSQETFTIETAMSGDFVHYHPYHYLPSEQLNKTLFILTEDYKLIRKLFPIVKIDLLLEHLVLINPTEKDLIELNTILYEDMGVYSKIQTVQDYIKTNKISGIRAHQTYLVFYFFTSVILSLIMVVNMLNQLDYMMLSYSIHHLFGANNTYTFMRMLIYIIGYNVLPFAAVGFVMAVNLLATINNIFLLVLMLLVMALTITIIKFRQFKIRFLKGMGRISNEFNNIR